MCDFISGIICFQTQNYQMGYGQNIHGNFESWNGQIYHELNKRGGYLPLYCIIVFVEEGEKLIKKNFSLYIDKQRDIYIVLLWLYFNFNLHNLVSY